MQDLDFSGKTVLVVGGSSGIGNGIAHAFRGRGAVVHVTGTRADAAAYRADEGSDLAGLTYHRLDVAARRWAQSAKWVPATSNRRSVEGCAEVTAQFRP